MREPPNQTPESMRLGEIRRRIEVPSAPTLCSLLVALALAVLAAACSAPTPSADELAARDATGAAATRAASDDADAAPTPSPALPLAGRLLFAPVEPGGRHAVVALDAATGARSELFVLAEDHDTLVLDLALSPDGGTLAYTLSAANAPTRMVLRALQADAEPVVLHEWEEGRSLNGLQWLPDGSGLVAGSSLLSLPEGGRMAVPTAFEILRYPVPAAGSDAGADEPILLYREPSEEFTILGAWDEASGRAVLLDGPGEAAYVRAIRVVEAADGQAGIDAEADAAAEPLATWPTAGSGYRFAAGPRAGRPEARWLAIVDEVEGAAGAPDSLPNTTPPSALRVAEPEGPGLAEIAALPTGMRASDLVWSADGAWLAWSETPYSAGTGVPKRVRVARLAPNGAPTRVLTATTGAGAIPLAFGPAIGALDAGDAPPLLTGAGVVVLDATDGDGSEAVGDAAAPVAEAFLPPAWDLPPPPENVEPSHALSGLGWPLGWVETSIDARRVPDEGGGARASATAEAATAIATILADGPPELVLSAESADGRLRAEVRRYDCVQRLPNPAPFVDSSDGGPDMSAAAEPARGPYTYEALHIVDLSRDEERVVAQSLARCDDLALHRAEAVFFSPSGRFLYRVTGHDLAPNAQALAANDPTGGRAYLRRDLATGDELRWMGALRSPNGDRFAVVDDAADARAKRLALWGLDAERALQTFDVDAETDGEHSVRSVVDMAWAPDERHFALLTREVGAPHGRSRIHVVDLEDGSLVERPAPGARDLVQIRWGAESSLELVEDAGHSWSLDLPGGTAVFALAPEAPPTPVPTPPPPPRHSPP